MVSKEKTFLTICFLILPKVANMGVTSVIVTMFYDVFEVCFLTEQLLCCYGRSYRQCGWCYCHMLIDVYLADVIAKVLADVIANLFMADVIAMCGWCYCHYNCCYIGWCYCQCDGWCFYHVWQMEWPLNMWWADVIALWQMVWPLGWNVGRCYLPNVADGMSHQSIILILVLCCYWEPHPTYEADGICLCSYLGMDHWLLCTWIL